MGKADGDGLSAAFEAVDGHFFRGVGFNYQRSPPPGETEGSRPSGWKIWQNRWKSQKRNIGGFPRPPPGGGRHL